MAIDFSVVGAGTSPSQQAGVEGVTAAAQAGTFERNREGLRKPEWWLGRYKPPPVKRP